MASSTSSISRFQLPPPEAWSTFPCTRCPGSTRGPLPPSDGLCKECREAERRPRPEAKTVEERLAEAGAPPRYAVLTRASWEKRYGSWNDHPQLCRLVGWPREAEAGSWLLFVTSAGHGERKTGLATAVLGEALEAGLEGLWTSQSGWLRTIKSSWDGGPGADPEHVVWNRAARAPVLLFDELGGVEGIRERGKPSWWRTQVTELLHYREAHQLPTIVTACLPDWRQVGNVHPSLVTRMDVPLKIALPKKSPPAPPFSKGGI